MSSTMTMMCLRRQCAVRSSGIRRQQSSSYRRNHIHNGKGFALCTAVSSTSAAVATAWIFLQQHDENCTARAAANEPMAMTASSYSLLERRDEESFSTPPIHAPSPTVMTSSQTQEEPYTVSVRAVKGYRVTMEDAYCIADGGRFTAIFDGHGGSKVSQLLQNTLYDTIQQYLQEQPDASVFSHVAALKQALGAVEATVLADRTLCYQGSTATAVWVHSSCSSSNNNNSSSNHRTLVSANVGDSRAVLSRNGTAVDLTRDHKPNDMDEKARIRAMGETIEWDRFSKVHRVKSLSLSRAIGDRYAKPVVSGEAEIKHFPIDEEKDEFILLASDGLWDTMSSQEAVTYVHRRLQQADTNSQAKLVRRRHMSKYLTQEAIRRGSGDNVCVIVVWLKDC